MKNMFMKIDKLPPLKYEGEVYSRKVKMEPSDMIPNESIVPVIGPEEKFTKYLDLICRTKNNEEYNKLDLLDRFDVDALEKETEKILGIDDSFKDENNDQLTLLFDEVNGIGNQMELFKFEYIGISDEVYKEQLSKARFDKEDEIRLFVYESNWFNIVNQKLYILLRDTPGIKDNVVAKLWLFYTLVITAETRCYDWRMVGTTYIRYESNNKAVPVKDGLFYSWMEGLLK